MSGLNKEKLLSALPQKYKAATFITLLFHTAGCIGMFTAYRQWFINNTPLNLTIAFVLILITQSKNLAFFIFLLLCFVTGMVVEMVGVHTGLLFGNYSYGDILGRKINHVPWLIGINWFIVMYCCGIIVTYLNTWIQGKYIEAGKSLPSAVLILSFVMDAAMLATFYDWIMEPVAIDLGFWKWTNDQIPIYNYTCWFVISALLLVVFKQLRFNKENLFAVHLFIIQVLFFGILRTFL